MRAFGEQDEARDEVVDDGLQAETDTDGERAGDDGQLVEAEADIGDRERRREDHAEIAKAGRDGVPQPGVELRVRQVAPLQPALDAPASPPMPAMNTTIPKMMLDSDSVTPATVTPKKAERTEARTSPDSTPQGASSSMTVMPISVILTKPDMRMPICSSAWRDSPTLAWIERDDAGVGRERRRDPLVGEHQQQRQDGQQQRCPDHLVCQETGEGNEAQHRGGDDGRCQQPADAADRTREIRLYPRHAARMPPRRPVKRGGSAEGHWPRRPRSGSRRRPRSQQ